MKISIVIPTYGRERVLVETLRRVLALKPEADEILVVDQTPVHDPETDAALGAWSVEGRIRWVRCATPSIPASMNEGLVAASGDIVLFLDDDVVPVTDLLRWHAEAFRLHAPAIVIGQVLQPGEEPVTPAPDGFRFCNDAPAWIADAIACNMAVNRATAIEAGGFDENFRGAAYRFEKEFALRAGKAGRAVYFEPRASIRHLRAERGGTRAGGSHLATLTPHHSVGAHYYELATGGGATAILRRIVRSVVTRHHLRKPWWIPGTLVAETRGLFWAFRLWLNGPKRLRTDIEHG